MHRAAAQTDAGEMECIIRRITIFHVPRSIFVLDIVTAGEMLRYCDGNTEAHPSTRDRATRGFSRVARETIVLFIGDLVTEPYKQSSPAILDTLDL